MPTQVDPTIWFVEDATFLRITTLVKHTREEAEAEAARLFPGRSIRVVDSGKTKPPGKCCNSCGDKPCS
jgi:hypothetical protein